MRGFQRNAKLAMPNPKDQKVGWFGDGRGEAGQEGKGRANLLIGGQRGRLLVRAGE